MRATLWGLAAFIGATVCVVVSGPSVAHAGTYPTNTCVSAKLTAAASACQQVLSAWSKWEKDPSKDPGNGARDAAITKATDAFSAAWAKAEQASTKKDVDCADTTVSSSSLQSSVTTAADDIVTTINTGVDLNDSADRTCRAKLLKAAAAACASLLKAEGKFVKGLKSDPRGTKRDAAKSKALNKFTADWNKAACAGAGTADTVSGRLSTLNAGAVADTVVSPNVADTWTMITPGAQVSYQGKTLAPTCLENTPYAFFVRRGTVNKLIVFYNGGGACWDYLTCGLAHTATRTVEPGDNPSGITTGLANYTNPANPFKDWNAVFVPYCSGDVHWGDATATYTSGADSVTVEHRGFQNTQVVEKWTREHFVNPDEVFVGGSSAGAYGAMLYSLYYRELVYPASKFEVFADAGNGVITKTFQDTNLKLWGIQASLPKWVKALNKPIEDLAIDKVAVSAALQYPDTKFAQYTTSWDMTQTLFYRRMVTQDDLNWWLSSCDWNAKMRAFALNAAAGASNYRYYIAAGSEHTVWGSNKIFTDTTGGVPLLIDWINAMLAGDAAWTNVECSNCDLLPGDPQPNPLAAPFGANGVVSCP